MVNCRYNEAWECTLYKKKDDKNLVTYETCTLCLKAKEISKVSITLSVALRRLDDVNKAIRTMNTYTNRLTRALEKMETAG